MKKIIAIFSVMLMFGIMVPNDGWGNNCLPVACDGPDNDEVINVNVGGGKTSGSGLCFYCQNSYAGSSQCDDHNIAGQKNSNGLVVEIYSCKDSGTDYWNDTHSTARCSGSDLIKTDISDSPLKHFTCTYSMDGSTYDYSGVNGASAAGIASVCVMCKCRSGYKPNAARTDCELDTSAQERCENDPSHGQWDATNSKCLCGTDKTNRDENQTYKVQGQECKCSEPNRWNGSECADPDQPIIDECQTSGGEWLNGKCDCTDVEPAKKPSQDEKTCVENTRYTKCTESHGDWIGGVDGTCTCDEKNKGLEPRGEVCECKDLNAIWYEQYQRCDTSPRALCEGTGGKFTPSTTDPNNGTCECDISGKNIKEKDGSDPVQCECKNDDYEWETDHKEGCKLKSEAEKRKENFETLKSICEKDWNSSWSPESWEWEYNGQDNPDGRDPSKWKCTCTGNGVKQFEDTSCQCKAEEGWVLKSDNPPYKCEQPACPALKSACEALGDKARYRSLGNAHNRELCVCECTDTNKVYAGGKCIQVDNPIAKICESISGATIGRSGKCVCLSTGEPHINGKCPPVINSGSASGGGASSGVTVPPRQIEQAKQKVSEAYDVLKSISDGFGRSHWKTASGNFNGARLASDSIAGVVLGTVGGVVTSNVIKKNQVKGGFESLQCTVGGQLVADFGDQFQVGIR